MAISRPSLFTKSTENLLEERPLTTAGTCTGQEMIIIEVNIYMLRSTLSPMNSNDHRAKIEVPSKYLKSILGEKVCTSITVF